MNRTTIRLLTLCSMCLVSTRIPLFSDDGHGGGGGGHEGGGHGGGHGSSGGAGHGGSHGGGSHGGSGGGSGSHGGHNGGHSGGRSHGSPTHGGGAPGNIGSTQHGGGKTGGHSMQNGRHAMPDVSRTPSMSRSNPRGQTSTNKSSDHKGSSDHVSRQGLQDQMKSFVQGRKQHGGSNKTLTQRQEHLKNTFSKQRKFNQDKSINVSNHYRRYNNRFNHFFNDDFFNNHHYRPNYYRQGCNWWSTPGWGSVCGWLPWGWDYPIYYDDDGYGIYSGTNLYDYLVQQALPGQQQPATVAQQQTASTPIPQKATATTQQGDWLPLGVFAAGKTPNEASFSNMFVQLAIDKQGDIGGTYYNASTDQLTELSGAIDRETQQATWKLTDKPDSPVMSAGVFNLTQDVVNVSVHFPDGTDQNWVLVRMDQSGSAT